MRELSPKAASGVAPPNIKDLIRPAAECNTRRNPANSQRRRATRLRLVSVFRQGWLAIAVALLNQRRLPTGRFIPKLWPCAEMREFKLRVNHDVPLAA